MLSPHPKSDWGLAHAFHPTHERVPRPSRVLCERAGFLADITLATRQRRGQFIENYKPTIEPENCLLAKDQRPRPTTNDQRPKTNDQRPPPYLTPNCQNR